MEVDPRFFFLFLLLVGIVWVWRFKRIEAKNKQFIEWHKKIVEESVDLSRQTVVELKAIHNLLQKSVK
jgi:hypothetical protein